MATRLKYNLAVKTGEYESQGQKKGRYQRIGRLMEKDDGGTFILLDALFLSVQLNGICNRERRDSIIVSMFEEQPRDGGGQGGGSAGGSDDIPFAPMP